jgi:argininosuccinate lyase
LQDLPLEELRTFSTAFAGDIYDHLKLDAVLAGHDVPGGTAPDRVRQAIHQAGEKLATLREVNTDVTHA